MTPFELGSGSSVSCENPNFHGFELRKRRHQACSFALSVVIISGSFFFYNVFPALVASLALSSRYVSLILVKFLLRDYYSRLLFLKGISG